MSKRPYPRTRLIADHLSLYKQLYAVVALFATIVVGGIVFSTLQQDNRKKMAAWPEIEAVVVTAEHEPFTTRGGKTSGPRELIESHLTFLYHVEGKDWRTSKFVEFPKELLPEYEEVLHAGSTVPIHVSPTDPKKIYLGDSMTWIQALKASAATPKAKHS